MARMFEWESIYEQTRRFLERCYVQDQSLLWPDRETWTVANVEQVRVRLIDEPIVGADRSFYDKLQKQMEGAPQALFRLLADMFYVYHLVSNFVKPATKRKDIVWAAQQAGEALPADEVLWSALGIGFCRTTFTYNRKHAQFWLLLLAAQAVKGMPPPERQACVAAPERLQDLLDQKLAGIETSTDRAYDMRHALLYMAFPDQYENSISTYDKRRIVDAFRDEVKEPLPEDLDAAIHRIRQALAPKYDREGRPFHFYQPDIKKLWKPGKSPTDGTNGESESTTELIDRVAELLERHTRNVILYGPPGTGKTYIARRVAESLVAQQAGGPRGDEALYVSSITFHQSYAYEDFVEGLRPVPSEGAHEGLRYEVVPGILRRVCARASADASNRYVLIIDEINRGNVAKILGELITLLEDDKRLDQAHALRMILPYSGESFGVPKNIYVIGTMNTADRSIALIDVALRRRFAFVELMPMPELLDDAVVESETKESAVRLGPLLRGLNAALLQRLGRDQQIGHSYLLRVAQASKGERLAVLEHVWNQQLVPLLEEYFYSEPDKLRELLRPMLIDEELADEASDSGAIAERLRLEGDDLLKALALLEDG